jgi:mono/diheme cytochrome c family protein
MKVLIGLFLLVLFSCGQDFNSNTFDESRYASNISANTAEGQRFLAAYNLIDSKCTSCHLGYHNSYSGYTTTDDWINNGLIVAGDFASSTLRNTLKNYGGDMPLQGSQFSDAEIEILQDWIDNL